MVPDQDLAVSNQKEFPRLGTANRYFGDATGSELPLFGRQLIELVPYFPGLSAEVTRADWVNKGGIVV
jgi:hypothetical protein